MTRRIAVALCLILAGSTLPGQAPEWQLAPARAGKVVIGMTVDSLIALFGRENTRLVDLGNEGMFTPAIQIFLPSESGAPIAVARINEICDFRVTGVSAVSPRWRTIDGLGVGSTVADVRKRYPAARMSHEEGSSLIVEKLQMSFVPTDGTFTDSTRIESVWLYNALPDSIRKCK
jgi:hypothetical protein